MRLLEGLIGRSTPGSSVALSRLSQMAAVLSLASVLAVAAYAPAQAAAGPQWTVTAVSGPTNFSSAQGSVGEYAIVVKNTGSASSSAGGEITVTDMLPAGLAMRSGSEISGVDFLSGNAMTCSGSVCTYSEAVAPDDSLVLTVPVEVSAGAPAEVVNVVTASGGGAPTTTAQTSTKISDEAAPFGIAAGSVATALSDAAAGAHPDLTVGMGFNTVGETLASGSHLLAGDPKETIVDLPPGFVGDIANMPTCPLAEFSKTEGLFRPQTCSLSTQVGTTTLVVKTAGTTFDATVPVYNLSPNPGEVAKLGFFAVVFGVQGTVSLRPGDYGIRTTFASINESAAQLDDVSLTIWGTPADAIHDPMRGLVCNRPGNCRHISNVGIVNGVSGLSSTSPPVPFLTNPTDCSAHSLDVRLAVSSWEQSVDEATASMGMLADCGLLEFTPTIAAAPDSGNADAPAGLAFDIAMPQEGLTSADGKSSSDVYGAVTALPIGVAVNPGRASGLAVCEWSQAKLEGEGAPECPPDSRVGTVSVKTPVLREGLNGGVYLLRSNPPDVKLLIAPEDQVVGLHIKLVGDAHLDEQTGQIVTTIEQAPQLPFSGFHLSLDGGTHAVLATPVKCGAYAVDAQLTPWSGGSSLLMTSRFMIDSNPSGGACPASLPFAPMMSAGSVSNRAGSATKFAVTLQRADGQQRISTLQVKPPAGLIGMIAGVPLCVPAAEGRYECPASSQIGHVVIEAGPGPYPLVVPQAGGPSIPIYLTGPYKGSPFGLLVEVPLQVGPFDLGTIIVRSKIDVDPSTAQVTVTTDPLPTIAKGVPTDVRAINAVIDRPGFMVNPTNCQTMAASGMVTSSEGASALLSSRFQAAECRSLPFVPRLSASTQARHSRRGGASLHVVVKSGPGQANIHGVKVLLPKKLPSRLATLKQACTEAQFNANPAGCPVASVVGTAKAYTPVLPVPMTGPAYFVSHGGAAFPDLVVVLEGDGVTIDLTGRTLIDKAGITSSTFGSIPDVPITRFDLVLPAGPHSALAANGNLCASRLSMPTTITGQNGDRIFHKTRIAVSGCPRHRRPRISHKRNGRSHKPRTK